MLPRYIERHRRVVLMTNGNGFSNQSSVLIDGVDEYINIDAVETALSSTTVGTWSCRVKPVDATPSAFEVFIGFGDTNEITYIFLYVHTNGELRVVCAKTNTTQWQIRTTSAAFSDNTWTYIAIVQNGTSPVLYVNGVAVAQEFIISLFKTVWFNGVSGLDNGRIGDLNYNSLGENGHFNGNVDRIRFWNVAKSAAEILDDYNVGCPKAVNTTVLVSEFAIDGDIVNTATDSFGSNNGTYVNVEQPDIEIDTVC